MKKTLILICAALLALTATSCSCNGDTDTTTRTSAATSSEAEATEQPTEIKTTSEEKAVKEAGLKVDDKGNVVDEKGNKVKTDKDGNITVKTDDGKTVKVSVEDVKDVNNNTNSNTSSKPNTGNNNNNSSSKPSMGNDNNTSSKPSTGDNNNSSKPNTGNNNNSSDTPSKVWHEPEYEYIKHPPVIEQVKVVDKEEYTYEETIYEEQWRTICNTCGADITGNVSAHGKTHMHNEENFSYHAEPIEVPVATRTVTVPEEWHYEERIIRAGWTEKVIIKEGGYY